MQGIFSFISTLVKNTTKTLVKQDKSAGVAALYCTCRGPLMWCDTSRILFYLCHNMKMCFDTNGILFDLHYIVHGMCYMTNKILFAFCHIARLQDMCDVKQIEFYVVCVTSWVISNVTQIWFYLLFVTLCKVCAIWHKQDSISFASHHAKYVPYDTNRVIFCVTLCKVCAMSHK